MAKKIRVCWEDLTTRRVDARLKEQAALARNRAYAALDKDAVKPQEAAHRPGRLQFLYHAPVYMALFGLLGGVLAWSAGQLLEYKPARQEEAAILLKQIDEVKRLRERGRGVTEQQIGQTVANMRRHGQSNPYFVIFDEPAASDAEKHRRVQELEAHERSRVRIARFLTYGAWGLLIALCLGIAEPATNRNLSAVVTNGSVAAAMGLLGGIAVALFVEGLYAALGGGGGGGDGGGGGGDPSGGTAGHGQVMARALSWAVLGGFLTAGTGLVLRSFRKLAVGVAGGMAGGLLGGLIYYPIDAATGWSQLGLLHGLCAIGVGSGAATGLIENVTKRGWVRVTAGLIAGKQFILYRNPTFIGSGPDCQIYLFRDQKVGRRHAAIHLVPGGFELEDLPLGTPTVINGKPAKRARLRHGDRISIGATTFLFQEKVPAAPADAQGRHSSARPRQNSRPVRPA